MEFLQTVFDGSLMPHGYCLLWRVDLLLLHVGGDSLTAAAYFAIPPALVTLVKRREDLEFDRIFLMFAAFIFLCGVTHLLSLLNIWQGFYFIEGLAKTFTGIVSALTAVAVWRLLPLAVGLPSRQLLLAKNEELEHAKSEILRANAGLEQKVRERTSELEKIAIIDPLTNTFRRAHVLAVLEKELAAARRHQKPLSVAMVDLDDFKRINDEYGHLAGDQVLQAVGALLNEASRTSDTVGRFGGEEFVVVMPECDHDQARQALERMAQGLRDLQIRLPSGTGLNVTCSAGTAQATPEIDSQALLGLADKALYRAKLEGKDRVIQD